MWSSTGPDYNTTGLGASLYATVDEARRRKLTLRREANTNIGTFNQSDLPVHFGLGAATLIDELLIQWPDGTKQSLYDVAVDQYLTVEYLPGDYSGNGVVDAADYVVWRDGLGTKYKLVGLRRLAGCILGNRYPAAAAGRMPRFPSRRALACCSRSRWLDSFSSGRRRH